MNSPLDAIIEIFTWVGFGAGIAFGIGAVIVWAADGSWLPAQAIVDRDGEKVLALWFDDDGDANRATISESELDDIGAADSVEIWYRHGWRDRMRLTKHAPAVRALTLLMVGMLALAVVALIASLVMLFVQG